MKQVSLVVPVSHPSLTHLRSLLPSFNCILSPLTSSQPICVVPEVRCLSPGVPRLRFVLSFCYTKRQVLKWTVDPLVYSPCDSGSFSIVTGPTIGFSIVPRLPEFSEHFILPDVEYQRSDTSLSPKSLRFVNGTSSVPGWTHTFCESPRSPCEVSVLLPKEGSQGVIWTSRVSLPRLTRILNTRQITLVPRGSLGGVTSTSYLFSTRNTSLG